jgi:hypothetical protein
VLTDSTWVQAMILVGGGTLVSIAGLLAVVRWVPLRLRAADHDVKAAFLSMAGVFYAILLAFVVVAVWTDFNEAGETSHDEVTRLSNLMRDSATFPAAAREPMRRSVLAYAESVVRDEWPSMTKGKASPLSDRLHEAMWEQWSRYSPRGPREQAFYSEGISRLNDVGATRRVRLIASRSTVPGAMWALLAIGFVVSIAFTYQFKMERLAMHVLCVGAIAALTGFVLFLIYALQYPFAGDVAVSPAPWVEFLQTWSRRPL